MEYNPQQGWEYESHPNFCMVEKKCNQILTSMSDFEKEQADYLGDTRPMHRLGSVEHLNGLGRER